MCIFVHVNAKESVHKGINTSERDNWKNRAEIIKLQIREGLLLEFQDKFNDDQCFNKTMKDAFNISRKKIPSGKARETFFPPQQFVYF